MLDFIETCIDVFIGVVLIILFSGCCATKTVSVEYGTPQMYKDTHGTGKIILTIVESKK